MLWEPWVEIRPHLNTKCIKLIASLWQTGHCLEFFRPEISLLMRYHIHAVSHIIDVIGHFCTNKFCSITVASISSKLSTSSTIFSKHFHCIGKHFLYTCLKASKAVYTLLIVTAQLNWIKKLYVYTINWPESV